jgi:hypothetical protein
MPDGSRIIKDGKPVIKYITIHHTAGEEWTKMIDWSKRNVIDCLSKIGYLSGYKPHEYDWSGFSPEYGQNTHLIPGTPNVSFSMYHYAIHLFESKYRVVELIDDPLFNQAGSTGDREHNIRSICVVFCGNFIDHYLPFDALLAFVNYFQKLYDEYRPKLIPHSDIDPKACPGKIKDQLQLLKEVLEGNTQMNYTQNIFTKFILWAGSIFKKEK